MSNVTIYLGQLNTSVTSNQFTADVSATAVDFSHNFIVDLKIPLDSIKKTFLYSEDDTGKQYVYVDKSQLQILHTYLPTHTDTSNAIDISTNSYAPGTAPTFGSDLSSNYDTSYDIIGPVTRAGDSDNDYHKVGFPDDKNVPMTWSYIYYLADQMLNDHASFTSFNNLEGHEATLYSRINDAFTSQLKSSLDAVDINGATHASSVIVQADSGDVSGKKGFLMSPDNTKDVNYESSIMADYIFDMVKNASGSRLTDPANAPTKNTLTAIPFIANDVILAKVTIQSPNMGNYKRNKITNALTANSVDNVVYKLRLTVV